MKITLEQYLDHYHTSETAKSYQYHIENFLALNPDAKNYGYKDIIDYLHFLSKRIENEASRGTQLAAIKKYYDYLLYTSQRSDHPCRVLSIKRSKPQIQFQELFTEEELQLLLERENRYKHLESRNKAMIMLLIYQGLRSEEIVNLKVDHIDLDIGTVTIGRTKTSARRILELRSNQAVVLSRYMDYHRPKLLKGSYKSLFITTRGVPVTVDSINRMLRPLQGLFPDKNLNAKTIRQSVISNWLNKRKLPLGDVQLMSGHKYPSSTERYMNQDAHSKRNLINRFHPMG